MKRWAHFVVVTLALCILAVILMGQGAGFNAAFTFIASAVSASNGYQQSNRITFHQIAWTVTGAPAACTVAVDSSPDGVSWTAGGIITGQTCTSNGNSAVTGGNAAFIRVSVTALSGGSSPVLTVNYTGWSYNPVGGSGTINANNGSTGVLTFYPAAGGSTTVGPDASLIDASNTLTYSGTTGVRLSGVTASIGFTGGKGQHFINQASTSDAAGVCSGTTTTCAIAFTTNYTSTPSCVITPTTAGVTSAIITTQANTGFTVTYAPTGTTNFNYVCLGNPN